MPKVTLDLEIQSQSIQRFAKLVCNGDMWLHAAKKLVAAANLLAPEIQERYSEIQERWNDSNVIWRNPTAKRFDDEFSPHHFQSVYLMLIAFALENVLKAFLVTKNKPSLHPQILQSGELPATLRSHDLVALAQQCDITLDEKDKHRLRRLTQHAVWTGRYHFPLDFLEFYHLNSKNKIPSSGIGYSSDEVDQTVRLSNQITKALGFKIKY